MKIDQKAWNKAEPLLFVLMCIVGILPLLFSKYFVTLDGPAHLYNARLITELLGGNNSELSNLFYISSFPVPNWAGHFIVAVLNILLPAYLSEKIVFLMYFTLTSIFFRKFILKLYPQNSPFTYLILLFVHNHLLYFGFLNMLLGVMFLFITAYYFIEKCERMLPKNTILLSLLLLAVFFSHLIVFLITITTLCIVVLLKAKRKYTETNIVIENTKELTERFYILFIASVPGILLAINYFIAIDSIEKGVRPELSELFDYIIDIRPLLTLCYCDHWSFYTHILFGMFGLLIVSNIYVLAKMYLSYSNGFLNIKLHLNLSLLWFIFSFAFLFLFLILPNSILLTERLIVFFYLFFIIWISSLKYPQVIKIFSLVVFIFIHLVFVKKHYQSMRDLSKDAEKITSIAEKIEINSLVLTFNFSNNWLHSHISGYLGSNKPLAVIENYEAALKWFPVHWNTSVYETDRLISPVANNREMVDFYINDADSSCLSMRYKDARKGIKQIPYVVIFGGIEEAKGALSAILNKSYSIVENNGLCTLYKLNSKIYLKAN